MASGRRGGPPDLKSTLGSLLRTTLEQVGAVKDVAKQQARSRGGLLDQALVQRRRKEALAKLGESVYRLSQRGELGELALDPEIAMALAEVDGTDDSEFLPDMDLESLSRRSGAEAVSSKNYRPAQAETARQGEFRVWRPVMPEDDSPEAREPDEGSLEADTLQDLPAPTAMLEAEDTASESASTEKSSAPIASKTAAPQRMTRKSARRGASGGINFVTEEPRPGDSDYDDDLDGYMHDDDVPE